MKKFIFYFTAMSGLLLASCSQDEPMAPLDNQNNKQISYTVTTGNGSRAASAYGNGTDVSEIHVAAWAVTPNENGKFALPAYGDGNTGNAALFDHDVVKRAGAGSTSTSGLFSYDENARFWPTNGERVDFWAIVDAPSEDNCFSWTGASGKHPGLPEKIMQLGKDEMKDMLFAYTPNQSLKKDGHQAQQNVSFSFNHAFAKVIITAQVRNSNLRVVVTDAQIHGIKDGGTFCFPYKSGESDNTVENPAHWITPEEYISITGLMDATEVVVDKNESLDAENPGKEIIAGVSTLDANNKIVKNNDILVIPASYSGRNGNGKIQTYIQLSAYAFNIAGNTFDSDTDMLVCGTKEEVKDEEGKSTTIFHSSVINVPVEFDWKIGTVNTYNIIFDCGTGGTVDEDPKNPSLVRIGYEVEVKPWENIAPVDKEYDFASGKTK